MLVRPLAGWENLTHTPKTDFDQLVVRNLVAETKLLPPREKRCERTKTETFRRACDFTQGSKDHEGIQGWNLSESDQDSDSDTSKPRRTLVSDT